MPHLERGAVVEILHLPRHGLRDLRMAVAERAAPHARDAVEEALALGGRVVRTLGAGEDSRPGVFLEVAVVGEGHPVGPGPEVHGLLHDCSFVFHAAPHTLSGRELTLAPRNWNERGGAGWAAVRAREREKRSKSYVFQYRRHLQLHHQPVEPHAAGIQGGGARGRPGQVRARGDLVDDAHARLQISRQSRALGLAETARNPAGEARGADSRHHADRRVPLFCGRGAARPEPKLLGLLAVERDVVLVPPRLHGDGGAQGHQEILAGPACRSPTSSTTSSFPTRSTRRATGTATCSACRRAGTRTSVFPSTGCTSRAWTSSTSARARSTRATTRGPTSGVSRRMPARARARSTTSRSAPRA